MKKDIQDLLTQIITDALKDLKLDKVVTHDLFLDIPEGNRFGDLSTNIALRLASITKRPSLELASTVVTKIRERLARSPLKNYIREIKIEGAGFINFYFYVSFFYDYLKDIITKEKKPFKLNFGKKKPLLIEFVSANPTGPLSVAHARQAAVGDSLANIFEILGFRVQREYYLNDEGNQVNILGKSIELRLRELSGEKIDFPEDHYQGEYIYDIAREVKSKNEKVKNLSEYGVKYILEIIKKELEDFRVKFDYWYSQKSLRESGKIKKALDFLKKKGLLYEQGGALWFKSTQFGDDKDRVVIKSDGSYTYLAPDIAYHKDKLKRGFRRLINLWGPDHHGYINRLKAAVKALGKDSDSLSIVIVQLASIFREGKLLQMSTRRGQYISLREVLDEVGPDASRFFFIMRRTSSHLDFDLDIAKKETQENPVYYIQYAYARICSILGNSPVAIKAQNIDFNLLKEKEEVALAKKIWQFSYILNICLNSLDPYMLSVYLQDLSERFHKFYDLHRVLGQDGDLTKARLALIKSTQITIACGLELLGVSRPKEM